MLGRSGFSDSQVLLLYLSLGCIEAPSPHTTHYDAGSTHDMMVSTPELSLRLENVRSSAREEITPYKQRERSQVTGYYCFTGKQKITRAFRDT